MIILTIGETSRRLSSSAEIEEGWLNSHLRPSATHAAPGVHVRIDAPPVELNLSAGDHVRAAAFDTCPRPLEARVLELWHTRGLDRPDFRSGQLVAFLHQLQDLLEQGIATRLRG